MDRYLVKKDESRHCSFTSNSALYSLLGISSRCDYIPEGKHAAGTGSRCTRSLEEWKVFTIDTLRVQTAPVNVPSPQASYMLELLSKSRVCEPCQEDAFENRDEYSRYCSRLCGDWQGKIWREYLVTHGVHSEEALDMLPADFSLVSWEGVLDVLKRTERISTMTVTMRDKKKPESVSTSSRATGAPSMSTRTRGRDSTDVTRETRGGDPFFEGRAREPEIDVSNQSGNNRPSLHRRSAPTDTVSNATSSRRSNNPHAGQQVSLAKELKTPERRVERVYSAESSLSPESVSSVSSDSPSSLFDRDQSPEADTPLSKSEIPPLYAGIDPISEEEDEGGHSETGESDRDGKPGIAVSNVNRRVLRPSTVKQRSSRYSREGKQDDTPTKVKALVKKPPASPPDTRASRRKAKEATPPVLTTEIAPVHAFVKHYHSGPADPLRYGLKVMQNPMKGATRAPGYVYCYRHEEHPGYLKIGYVTCEPRKMAGSAVGRKLAAGLGINPFTAPAPLPPHEVPPRVAARYRDWERGCGYGVVHVFSYAMPCAAQRMEALVHAELQAERRWVDGCNPQKKDQPCAVRHNEWFETTEDAAREAVLRWQRFSQRVPYDGDGNLKKRWVVAVTVTGRRAESGERAAGRPPGLAGWIEEQMALTPAAREAAKSAQRQAKKESKDGTGKTIAMLGEAELIGKLKKARTLFF